MIPHLVNDLLNLAVRNLGSPSSGANSSSQDSLNRSVLRARLTELAVIVPEIPKLLQQQNDRLQEALKKTESLVPGVVESPGEFREDVEFDPLQRNRQLLGRVETGIVNLYDRAETHPEELPAIREAQSVLRRVLRDLAERERTLIERTEESTPI